MNRVIPLLVVALVGVALTAQADQPTDPCFSACSNLRVMFVCKEGGDWQNHYEPCVSDCRAGKVPWNVDCARNARTIDQVHACGITCDHRGVVGP